MVTIDCGTAFFVFDSYDIDARVFEKSFDVDFWHHRATRTLAGGCE